jgi:hypothetical protein
MPLVKEIIDVVLADNPNIAKGNIFEKICGDFKDNGKLRRLIKKLMKSNSDSFEDIFDSLKRVVATFGEGGGVEEGAVGGMDALSGMLGGLGLGVGGGGGEAGVSSPDQAMDMLRHNILGRFREIVRDVCGSVVEGSDSKEEEVVDLNDADCDSLFEALSTGDADAAEGHCEQHGITAVQLAKIQERFKSEGLHKACEMSKSLNKTVSEMMSALQSNDETAVEQMLAKAASELPFDVQDVVHSENSADEDDDAEDDDAEGDDAEDDDAEDDKTAQLPGAGKH